MKEYGAKVSTGPLNVRQEPSPSAKVLKTIKIGSALTVLEEKDGFAKIGDDEWVNMNFIDKCKSARSNKPKSKKSEVMK